MKEMPKKSLLLLKIVNNHEVNFILTSIFAFLTIYGMLIALFNRNVLHPLQMASNATVASEEDFADDADSMSMLSEDHHTAGTPPANASAPAVARGGGAGGARGGGKTSTLFHSKVAAPAGGGALTEAANASENAAAVAFFPTNGRGVTWLGEAENSTEFLMQTIISLFALWISALALGHFAAYLCFPPLFGMAVSGICFANSELLVGVLSIHQKWGDVVRQVAFILCLIRCGISIDPFELRKTWLICANLAVASATVEVLSVVLLARLAFGVPVEIAIIFAFVLASNSPPITIPEMLQLEGNGRGTEKRIPKMMLTTVAIDNTYCVMSFIIISSTVFRQDVDDVIAVASRIVADLAMGIVGGATAGFALRFVPRHHAHLAHFTRAALLFTTSCAFLLGSLAVRRKIAGPVAVLALSIVASARWRRDNHRMNKREERTFKIIWDLLFQPLTFALIGLLIDFSAFSPELLLRSLATLAVALTARILSTFVVSLFVAKLNFGERVFVALCFVPKATAQAIIFPFMVGYCNIEPHTRYVALTAILSILVTAPAGRLLSGALGPCLLRARAAAGDEDAKGDESDASEARPHISVLASHLSGVLTGGGNKKISTNKISDRSERKSAA